MLRRRARLVLLAVVVGIAAGVGVAVAPGSRGTSSMSPSQLVSAARAQARSLLSTLRLPPGSARSATEPADDDGQLAPDPAEQVPPGPSSAPYGRTSIEVAYGWWTVPATARQVVAFLQRFPPRAETSADDNVDFADSSGPLLVSFQWPAVADLFGGRQLTLSILELPSGDTAVLAYASVGFISPRGDTEQIPSDAGELIVTTAILSPHTFTQRRPIVVTSPARIRKVAALLNGLPLNDHSTFDCNSFGGVAARVSLVFRSRRSGRQLALAAFEYLLRGKWSDGVTCDSVVLVIGGDSDETPLLAKWSPYADLGPFPPLLGRLDAALGGQLPTGAG